MPRKCCGRAQHLLPATLPAALLLVQTLWIARPADSPILRMLDVETEGRGHSIRFATIIRPVRTLNLLKVAVIDENSRQLCRRVFIGPRPRGHYGLRGDDNAWSDWAIMMVVNVFK